MNLAPQKVLHLSLEEKKKKPNINHNYMLSEKLDGWYFYIDYIVGKGWGEVHSRQQRAIPSLAWATNLFLKLPTPKENIRLIGEVYIPDLDFYTMNGLFNRSKGEVNCFDAVFAVHDLLKLDSYYLDWEENKAYNRFITLQSLLAGAKQENLYLHKFITCSSVPSTWYSIFEDLVSKDKEGLVLKQADAIYQPGKKNSSLLKLKAEAEADVLVSRLEETVGEKGNPNLNLIVVNKLGVETPIRIGRHNLVAKYRNNPDVIVDKVVKILYMRKNESGGYREPRFYAERFEKTKEEID